MSNRAAPWQTYLIAAYAAFVGEAFEGFIVDTNHWRHFFLLLGLTWAPPRRRSICAAVKRGALNLAPAEMLTSSV